MVTPKERYFKRVYDEAPFIKCLCGCGTDIKSMDRYARPKSYVSGHNTPVKYDDPKQYKREWNHRNRKSRADLKMETHRLKRVQTILLSGGNCVACGVQYDGTNACIFHFHHRNPKFKLFNIGNMLMNVSWARIVAEIKKCDLLCANCHEMKHSSKF